MQTTTEKTNKYIDEHPFIKSCLKKDLINYSALARLIGKELNIEKKTSMEAILIAARRYREKLQEKNSSEKKIKELLQDSELEMKNKIAVFILEKNINFENISKLQKKSDTFYLIEGSETYTLIVPEKHSTLIVDKFNIIQQEKDLALINVKTAKSIQNTPGVVAFLTSLFSENGINILEFISSFTDTMFIIKQKDVTRVIEILHL